MARPSSGFSLKLSSTPQLTAFFSVNFAERSQAEELSVKTQEHL